MLAVYLTGDVVALRAFEIADTKQAMAWHEGVFPIDPERAEKYLRDELDGLNTRKAALAIVRRSDDAVVGGVRVRLNPRHSDIYIQMAPALPEADELRGEVLKLLVPWLRDEGQNITVTVDLAADAPLSIAAARDAGMEQTARFREWYFRSGGRVDRLVFQAIHPQWQTARVDDA